ncbi:alpha/beta fold hydrolase [Streptomyces sp. NPDC046977]|uniref:alpha/beta fold hydrolase n=1 Tax=Streptomyces sp. NPDC046977 TaxID=3154703 RepID=UPI0033F90C0E
MAPGTETPAVPRGPHRLFAEVSRGAGTPVVLMHGFPDNCRLYDRLMPHLRGHAPVVRFDFLGWGRSDKPPGHPYCVAEQEADLAAVADSAATGLRDRRLILVAHDASGPPAIDWALAHPGRVARLVLLNTYYHWTPSLRRPPAIALYSTPLLRAGARAVARRRPDLDRRLFAWQIGSFIRDPVVREASVALLYEEFPAARPAFWRLNDELPRAVLSRRRRIPELQDFQPRVRVVFGARDRWLNARVARQFAVLFPHSELRLLLRAGHYVQIDEPALVAGAITAA